MNLSKFRFTLDLHSIQSQASIPVMVGDTSVTLIITITDGGLSYHIEDGCLAKISIKRPTGTHLEEFCVVKNNAVVEYAFSQNENTCAVPGVHVCDIILYGADGGVVGTPRFTMVVSERVIRFDDIVLTDEDFTAVDAMVKQEAVRNAQELQRVRAEEQRAIAEVGRIAAEAERVNAGKVALQAAEEAKSEADRAKSEADRAMESDPTVPAWAKKPNPPTAAEIGAAPAGLFDGAYSVSASATDADIDTMLTSALSVMRNYEIKYITFTNSASSNILPNGYWTMKIDKFTPNMAIVEATKKYEPIYTKLVRAYHNGSWQSWEWVNPLMQLGVEYRTTERYMRKPVYVKAIDFGLLPASAKKETEYSNANVYVVDYGGRLSDGRSLPYNGVTIFAGTKNVVITTTTPDYSSQNAYAWVKYTKD